MAKAKNKKRVRKESEPESKYFLKLVLYLVVGSQWMLLVNPEMTRQIPIPVGFLIGLWFASRDRFMMDRKIEYALLLVAALVGFWSHIGIYISIL